MKVAIKDVRPNPFRRIEHYPIRAEKVTALRESLRSTGYWGGLSGRTVNGEVQISFGHHRLQALKDEFGPTHEIDVIVEELSDEQMLKRMARENSEEWGADESVHHETVRATIEAYATGKIDLPTSRAAESGGRLRYAPSFVVGDRSRETDRPYSAASLGNFLGWSDSKVKKVLEALALLERKVLTEDDFKGLTVGQTRQVVAAVHQEEKRATPAISKQEKVAAEAKTPAARERAAAAAEDLRAKARESASRAAREEIERQKAGVKAAVVASKPAAPGETPDINDFAQLLARELNHLFTIQKRKARLDELVQFGEHLDPEAKTSLVYNLRKVAKQATAWADKLEPAQLEAGVR